MIRLCLYLVLCSQVRQVAPIAESLLERRRGGHECSECDGLANIGNGGEGQEMLQVVGKASGWSVCTFSYTALMSCSGY